MATYTTNATIDEINYHQSAEGALSVNSNTGINSSSDVVFTTNTSDSTAFQSINSGDIVWNTSSDITGISKPAPSINPYSRGAIVKKKYVTQNPDLTFSDLFMPESEVDMEIIYEVEVQYSY